MVVLVLYLLWFIGEPRISGWVVAMKMAVQDIEAEVAHLTAHDHMAAPIYPIWNVVGMNCITVTTY